MSYEDVFEHYKVVAASSGRKKDSKRTRGESSKTASKKARTEDPPTTVPSKENTPPPSPLEKSASTPPVDQHSSPPTPVNQLPTPQDPTSQTQHTQPKGSLSSSVVSSDRERIYKLSKHKRSQEAIDDTISLETDQILNRGLNEIVSRLMTMTAGWRRAGAMVFKTKIFDTRLAEAKKALEGKNADLLEKNNEITKQNDELLEKNAELFKQNEEFLEQKVASVVLENAPSNASYTSPDIQKEILYVFSNKVKKEIRQEIGDSKFCIIVDEARDESKREQMTLVLRFVDKEVFIRERFFGVVHGYDGASNMRGEWNGLQALICNECPYAYYIHCLDHHLQLALVAASQECNDELMETQVVELATKIANDEIESGRKLNQIGTLKQAGDTPSGPHLDSISSLLKMFNSTYVVLKILEITRMLCVALQCQSQDILNTMHLISSTKRLLKNFQDSGCDAFFIKVKSFCEQHQVDIPDMNAQYVARRGSSRNQQVKINVMHYYQVDIFITTLDYQLQELKYRFNEHSVELLVLSTAFDHRDRFKLFKIDDICKLAKKFHLDDFSEELVVHLRIKLQHFELDIPNHPELQNLSSIHELCQGLVKTEKEIVYPLIDRLLRLVLTLLVSTTTTERAFSIMKIIKTKLRNKMEDNFLSDCLTVCIEKEIAAKFSSDSIIDDFASIYEESSSTTYF
ncbi:uncharacterized protein LOC133791421 [Humulus lupulus]|uniref:uncharacterized protein LOC133791421 n=1 Tax=Humulus lupulus TaxID=3486 RepID=UPI002B4149CC|nr:uncharacterized protein LOC133791421 [Humulus lupulus]